MPFVVSLLFKKKMKLKNKVCDVPCFNFFMPKKNYMAWPITINLLSLKIIVLIFSGDSN